MRTYFRQRLRNEELLAAAYSLESVLIELIFIVGPLLVAWPVERRTARSFLGPLGETGFVPLTGVIFCYSMAFGLLEVGFTGYATEAGNIALAGVLLGLMSAGSALGGLAYGSRSWRLPLARQFALMLALMGAGLAVLALPWSPLPFALWSLFAGVVMAPALIIQSMLVAKTARPEQRRSPRRVAPAC